MKGLLITIGVVLVAATVGYFTFDIIAGIGADEATGEGDAHSEMIGTLVTSVLVAAIIGVAIVVWVLPYVARAIANTAYDQSSQKFVAPNKLDEARSLEMQGEYEQAVEAYKQSLEDDGPDRLAWIGIADIQLEHFEEAESAVETLKEAIESNEWGPEDDVNLHFRLAELYLDPIGERDEAVLLYKHVLQEYEENHYYVNEARNHLHELGVVV